MNLLFFQNCISPHQLPYIKELMNDKEINNIFLIVPRYDYNERKKLGWDSNELIKGSKIQLIYKPSTTTIKNIINLNNNTYCFFSGIRADKDIFSWFKISFNYNVKRYIITEPPYTFKIPLWMHYIRFFIQDYKFIKYINGIFAIGEDAVKYYKSISKKWDVFPFQYVTEHNTRIKDLPTGKLKLLFVGSLCKRKNVKIVIEALKGLNNVEFTIIGNGEEKYTLEALANRNSISVSFLGTKNMKEIPTIMQEYDILILPSLHDGWGAVVNEAMDLGLYVIVSDKCGAKTMVTKGENGDIFTSNNIISLKKCLLHAINNKERIRNDVYRRINSFNKYRSKSAAEYFKQCLK